MNNGAISRQTHTLLISRWLIDPNGNVYQRDAKDENIIILPRLIAVFKAGGAGGQKGISGCLRSQGEWILEVPLWFCLWGVCSRFIALIKGYGIFNITYLNNWDRELNMAVGAPGAGDAVISGGQVSALWSRPYPPRAQTPALAWHPSSIKTPLPKIHHNSSQQQRPHAFYFSVDHKYTHSFLCMNFLLAPLLKTISTFISSRSCLPCRVHLRSGVGVGGWGEGASG